MDLKTGKAALGFFGDKTVFYTRKGTHYHVVNCPLVNKKGVNVTQIKQALKWGLKPCRKCKPDSHILFGVKRPK